MSKVFSKCQSILAIEYHRAEERYYGTLERVLSSLTFGSQK